MFARWCGCHALDSGSMDFTGPHEQYAVDSTAYLWRHCTTIRSSYLQMIAKSVAGLQRDHLPSMQDCHATHSKSALVASSLRILNTPSSAETTSKVHTVPSNSAASSKHVDSDLDGIMTVMGCLEDLWIEIVVSSKVAGLMDREFQVESGSLFE